MPLEPATLPIALSRLSGSGIRASGSTTDILMSSPAKVQQVLGQQMAQVVLIDDRRPVEELPAHRADD